MNSLRILLIWVLTASVLLGQSVLPNRRKVFQAAAGTTLNDGLIAYWKMDEAGDNTVDRLDSYGANDLDAVGTGIVDISGILGNAVDLEFSGNDYLIVNDNAALSFVDEDFTIACWVRLESESSLHRIVDKWNTASEREYMMAYSGAANRFQFFISSDGSASTSVSADTFGAASLETWYFVAAGHVASTDTIWISVNAGTKDTASHTTGCRDGTSNFRVGRGADGSNGWDGEIDEVAVFGRELTDAELDELYNAGAAITCCPFP